MNKIAVVGHPSIASQTLADMLHQQGIAQAQPSKREQLLPAEITATLCQAHQVPAQAHLHAQAPLIPVKIGAVWHGLALDLLLGNMDQNAWCWADPRTIFVLDYWHDIDPDLAFILVYDHPAQALLLDVPDVEPPIREKLDHWVAYHQVLLSFYHRHRERCLLVHAQQAREKTQLYLDDLQKALKIPLAGAAVVAVERANPALEPSPIDSLVETLTQAGLASDDNLHLLTATQVESYLTPDLLAAHPASAQLYQELQAAANLPWDGEISNCPSAEDAWQALLHQRHQISELISRLLDEKTALTAQLQQEKGISAKLRAKSDQLAQQIKESKEENELLLLQLHQVQEELERHFLEVKTLQEEKEKSVKTQTDLTAQLQQEKEKASKAQAELKAQLAQQKTLEVHDELQEENELLLLQLHQVQEELERYFLENQELKQGRPAAAPAAQPAQAYSRAYYGAADRIKSQLTYRLGATMVAHSRKPAEWLRMPGALLREVKDFKREKPQREAQKLPPIHTYADAYEAERVKRHLSYRLGVVLMEHYRSPWGWLTMPSKMRKAVLAFRAERR